MMIPSSITRFVEANWNAIAADYVSQARWSEVRAARAFALLNMALHDAAVGCWDAKFTYFNPRPSQLDPSIQTVIGLPNFPSYTSGHSTFSAAAAAIETATGAHFPLDMNPASPGKWGILRRVPLGPVAAITPFNFPLNLTAHKVAPAMERAADIPLLHIADAAAGAVQAQGILVPQVIGLILLLRQGFLPEAAAGGHGALAGDVIGDRTLYGSLGFVFWADALCLIATYILLLPEVLRGRGRPRLRAEMPAIEEWIFTID